MSTFPSILAGQDITADLLNLMLTQSAFKTADTSRSSTTTPAADPDLTLPVVADATYGIDAWIAYTATSGDDMKAEFTGPAGATATVNAMYYSVGGGGIGPGFANLSGGVALGSATIVPLGSGATVLPVFIRGILVVGSTAGSLTFNWSQNTSNAAATTVKAGSWLQLTRMA